MSTGKPQYGEGIATCPNCGSRDNVSLTIDGQGVVWCECGRVYIRSISLDGEVYMDKIIEYDKGE